MGLGMMVLDPIVFCWTLLRIRHALICTDGHPNPLEGYGNCL